MPAFFQGLPAHGKDLWSPKKHTFDEIARRDERCQSNAVHVDEVHRQKPCGSGEMGSWSSEGGEKGFDLVTNQWGGLLLSLYMQVTVEMSVNNA